MLQLEVLVGKGPGAIYTSRTHAIAAEEVASLTHEVGDLDQRNSCQSAAEARREEIREAWLFLTIRWNLDPL
jgi:hypothetical protein